MDGDRLTGPAAVGRPRKPPGTSEFSELAKIIRDSGLLRRRYGYYWTKLVALPLTLVAALLAFVWIGDTWWQLFTCPLVEQRSYLSTSPER